jgi:nucleotidyltransferase substrate binding protein (TIGR01987 family)
MSVSLAEFEKAIKALDIALKADKTELNRDATIQRFEFTVELAWKTSKKIMGTSSTAPKQVIREMAQNSLIDDPEKWLLAIDKRNLSSHTYNEDLAEIVYNFARDFLPLAQSLLTKLSKR